MMETDFYFFRKPEGNITGTTQRREGYIFTSFHNPKVRFLSFERTFFFFFFLRQLEGDKDFCLDFSFNIDNIYELGLCLFG